VGLEEAGIKEAGIKGAGIKGADVKGADVKGRVLPQPEKLGGVTDRGVASMAGPVDTEDTDRVGVIRGWPLAIMFQPITEETVASAFTGAADHEAATIEAVAAALGALLNSLT
jgi:hypothetical protein